MLILGGVMLLLTWGLGLAGFLTGDKRFFPWAGYAFALGFAIVATPMITFLIVLVIEKLRGKRHD
ncbi:MAG: hypothetical protein KF847_20285 [Pirellulales bacterium]|nr:hypothetical protein [Pirellulales bacterium]